MKKKTTYTIKRINNILELDTNILNFFKEEIPNISKMFGDKFDFDNCVIEGFLRSGIVLVCERDGEITGLHASFISKSPFDFKLNILTQQIFYVKPDSGRTAYHLFKKFIDIGKREADHIITMLTSQTNIKPQTLQNMGFKELETLYRMEV